VSTIVSPRPRSQTAAGNSQFSGLMRAGVALVAILFALVWALTAYAQTTGGLAGGPVLGDSFQRLDKTPTRCGKCLEQEHAFHAQVDVYEAALAAYEAQGEIVRQAADTFVASRETADRLKEDYDALDRKVWDLLSRGSDGYSDYDYREAADARDRAEQPALDAQRARDEARSALYAELRALERLRLKALQEMRLGLRLLTEMYQCEFACSPQELDLDEPEPPVPTPATGTIDPSLIPVPEDFIGVVAKCAKCQPEAEIVNTIRSHRRAFAATAQSLSESLTHNREVLNRAEHEARVLEQEERALYRNLLQSFSGQGPGETADRLDQVFDARDQREAAESLKAIAQRRAENARLRTGLAETIAIQLQGVLEAVANYRVHTVLLQAAEQRLTACEQSCKPADGDQFGLNDPTIDRAYPVPENFGPISAACPECQPVADALAQAKSERRRVASDIQDIVWLLKSRRASLERDSARLDVLDAEENGIAEKLLSGVGAADEAKLVDRLFEIEAEETELVSNTLWAEDEIRRMEPQLKALIKTHEELTWRVEELRAELEVCEFNCPGVDDGSATAVPGPVFDPTLPQPELFKYVTTDCPSCQPLADALNALLLEGYSVAVDIQSTAARIASHEAAHAKLDAAMAELLKRESELAPISTGTSDAATRDAATRELRQIDAKRQRLEAEIAAAIGALRRADSDLAAARAYYDQLVRDAADTRARLALCEKDCPGDAGGAIGLTGQDDFVTTDCPPCEVLASQVNDAVGTLISAERDLAAAKARFGDLIDQAKSRQADLDAVLAKERALNDEWLSGASDARRAEIDAELNEVDRERNRLTDEQANEASARRAALGEIDAAQARVDDLTRQVADLKAQLAECEEQCAPRDDGGAVALPDPSPFVRTDCPPCEVLASLVNDAVGTLIGAERGLEAAKGKLQGLKDAAAQRATDLEAVLARERALNDEWLSGASDARRAEIDAELNEVDRERNRLTDEQANEASEQAHAQAELDAAQARVDDLTRQVADLKAQLAECEEQCAPRDDGGAVALPDPSPFVRTACPPCEVLASLVNDAVGTLIGAERGLEAAKGKLQGLKDAAAQRATDLEAVLARERALNDEWLSGASDARRAEIDAELNEVDRERNRLTDEQANEASEQAQAQAELDAAQARVDDLTRQVADLKAQLAECEEQCAPRDDGGAVALPDPSPFVRTDCPPCEVLASLVNDAVGTLIGSERGLEAAKGKLQGLKDAAAQRATDLEAVLARETALNDEWLSGASDARKAEIDAELNEVDRKRNRLTDEQANEASEQAQAQAELDAAQARVDDLTRQVADLKAQLAECEEQCAPRDDGGAVALPDPSPFVRTDCPPCEVLASLVNDAVGSAITTKKSLTEAQAALTALRSRIAETNAAKSAAQDAFGAALVEKSRLEAAGGEGSAQQAIADDQIRRASELLSDLDALELEELDLAERVEVLTDELAYWRRQEAKLRNDLAECERQCGGPGPATAIDKDEGDPALGFDSDFILDKLQPEKCQVGSDCTFEIAATNAGDTTYGGPLFLRESRGVAAGQNGAAFGDWHCSPAANGQSICLTTTEVTPGETITLRIPIRLPSQGAVGGENCVDVIVAVDARLLAQLVQVGLAARGFDPGTADGWPGPRTNAAIATFAEQAGLEIDPADLASVYVALFGQPPPSGAGTAGRACVTMDVEPAPRAAPVPNRTPAPLGAQTQPDPQPRTEDPAPRSGINIGIGLELGGGGRDIEREGGREGGGIGGPRIELPFGNIFGN
jgi:polyhydroxyalkanoate synthesis regulator phasin